MPANKEALIRYRIIDEMLRDKQMTYPSMDDFINVMENKLGKEFSLSTIQKDIKAMKQDSLLGFLAPIKYSKRDSGYYYSDENYSISNIPLSEQDLESLEFAATLLQQFKGVKMFNDFGSAVDKIFNAINVSSLLSEEEIEESIQFEKVPSYKGSDLIGKLLEHIKERECIEIEYQKFNSDEVKTHTISPFLLKEYRNRWYLIGMNHKHEYINTFGLDRIDYIEKSESKFKFHKSFSPKTYFKHAFGITTFNGKAEEIILSFNKFQRNYVLTQELHESQTIISDTEKELVISLNVGITVELTMAIMSFGENVKVLSPDSLKDKIKEKLLQTIDHYK